jgi:hypothetical protein
MNERVLHRTAAETLARVTLRISPRDHTVDPHPSVESTAMLSASCRGPARSTPFRCELRVGGASVHITQRTW